LPLAPPVLAVPSIWYSLLPALLPSTEMADEFSLS